MLGCFLGAITHVLFDMLVHSEMQPLWPLPGNLFYIGWMEPLSLALLPFAAWLVFQYVQACRLWLQKHIAKS